MSKFRREPAPGNPLRFPAPQKANPFPAGYKAPNPKPVKPVQ